MAKFVNVFPLSIYKDKIELSSKYKNRLTDLIFEMEKQVQPQKSETSAWLGDTRGFEFLFQQNEFAELYQKIGQKVKNYTDGLGINNDTIDFYFQRSWATITRRSERIHEHAHEQSNISFAYYLRKPPNSGGINFITYDHPNEFSKGIFTPAKESLGFIKEPGIKTWNTVSMDAQEDDIVIFPSKTLHSTTPNPTDDPRISISADVVTMLKQSHGHETMMPHVSEWRPFA